jgi:hypothetical protein
MDRVEIPFPPAENPEVVGNRVGNKDYERSSFRLIDENTFNYLAIPPGLDTSFSPCTGNTPHRLRVEVEGFAHPHETGRAVPRVGEDPLDRVLLMTAAPSRVVERL